MYQKYTLDNKKHVVFGFNFGLEFYNKVVMVYPFTSSKALEFVAGVLCYGYFVFGL